MVTTQTHSYNDMDGRAGMCVDDLLMDLEVMWTAVNAGREPSVLHRLPGAHWMPFSP